MLKMSKRLVALAALAGIVVGFPALLWFAVGNPWPAGGLDELSLMSNSAILGLVSLLGWLVWVQLVLCIVWEIPPALRRDAEGAPRLPIAAGGQQRLMRMLVHTVFAVGVGSTTLLAPGASFAQAVPPPAPTPHTQAAHAHTHTEHTRHAETNHSGDRPSAQAEQSSGESGVVVTAKGDTLWGLAETHLGDGFRWHEIAQLNQGRKMANGHTFTNAGNIEPGWTLLMPARASTPTAAVDLGTPTDERVVKPGESLSSIAEETTGSATSWPALYEVNHDVIGDNPDLIHPGQVLHLPVSGTQGHPEHEQDQAELSQPEAAAKHAPPGVVSGTPEPGDEARGESQGQRQRREVTPPGSPTTPAEAGSGSSNRGAATVITGGEHDDEGELTALRALLASAVCLSAGALGLLMTNRRRQFRRRRVGRTVASIPDELIEVEQAVHENGSAAQEDVEFLDRALRHVAASCKVAEAAVPQLGAAVLGDEDLTLLFTEPAQAPVPEGWTATDDARAWMLPRWTFLEPDLETQPAPYPAVVSIGEDDGGRTWLLDLETLGRCGVAGEPEQVADLVRFVVAELAVNAWSEGSDVLLTDEFGTETLGLNPARLRQVARSAAIARAEAVVGEMDAAEANLGADLLTRRRDGLVLDSAHPVVVVVSSRPEETFLTGVSQRDRSRVVVVHGGDEDPAVELAGDGTAFLPMWGISLKAFTLPAGEAQAMADLVASTRNLHDQPVPATTSDDGPLGKYANADGSLRAEYTEPRHTEGNDPSSQLPEADAVYLATAATTAVDLAVAAPSVPEQTRAEIASLDPNLDQDVADWFDETSPRPKIHLLGPVTVTSLNGGDPGAIDNLAGTISFIAYLACQDRGVTGERAAAACGWKTPKTVQNRATNARFVLGTRPDGSDWLPDASMSDGARRGSTPTYELVRGPGGVLNSADLFVRLKFRAQKRGDQGGEDDLVRALSLVTGAPFEAATEHRFKWLFKVGQQRHDEILVGAIHDAAHVLATRAVTEGRTDLVRLACAAAHLASPHSDIAWLDEAAATEAESGRDAAGALVREQILERLDEDLPARSESIVDQREWGATG